MYIPGYGLEIIDLERSSEEQSALEDTINNPNGVLEDTEE